MARINIPVNYHPKRALLADDEPEHLVWLVDFLKVKGFETTVVTNVRDAINSMSSNAYRIYFIDLNIPLGGWQPTIAIASKTYGEYFGLYLLKYIRTQGNNGRRVIAYSAHQNDLIGSEIKRLYCGYVLKGRPRQLKDEIEQILLLPDNPADHADRNRGKKNLKPMLKRKLVRKKIATKK